MFPMETMYAFKVAEVAKYTFRNPEGMYTTAFGLIMNADSYDDLSAASSASGGRHGTPVGKWFANANFHENPAEPV